MSGPLFAGRGRAPAPPGPGSAGPGGPATRLGQAEPCTGPRDLAASSGLRAVLFDRDGTLVHDVPYNADPRRVRPMPCAVEAVAAVRAAGLATGVVSNQSGIGRGLLTAAQVRAVNDRVDAVFGPFDVWVLCPHRPDTRCPCRKPLPGLVLTAARRLGVPPQACAVIGDIGADLRAARAAGARAAIVPTPATRPEEYAGEPAAAPDLLTAVRRLLGGPVEKGVAR